MNAQFLLSKQCLIWLWGVGGFGLVSALWASHDDVREQLSQPSPDWLALGIGIPLNFLIIGLLGGYLWGWIVWRVLSVIIPRPGREQT